MSVTCLPTANDRKKKVKALPVHLQKGCFNPPPPYTHTTATAHALISWLAVALDQGVAEEI